jgi:hypothetical protein
VAAGLWRRDERAADTKKKTSSGPAVVLTTLGIGLQYGGILGFFCVLTILLS